MPALPTHYRAAALMLGSTVFFALMVVAIRLASARSTWASSTTR